jgi:hypothetical protein
VMAIIGDGPLISGKSLPSLLSGSLAYEESFTPAT